MQVLKDDKSAIFKAAAAAQRMGDYIDQQVTPRVELLAISPEVTAANEPAMQVVAAKRKAGPR